MIAATTASTMYHGMLGIVAPQSGQLTADP
jgi:hypothetical protein